VRPPRRTIAGSRENDPLHRTGCMLYRAEGSKRRYTLLITNADADLLATCLEMLQRFYGAIQEHCGIDRPEWLDL
jgi:hypothetical protein